MDGLERLVRHLELNHERSHRHASGDRWAGADAIRSVGVIGGGTAGYLTALALRKQLPHLDVTVVESSSVPVIGVGEATIPAIVEFLHATCGIDIVDFYQKVRPTWKLGIKFHWGPGPDVYFNAPFDWHANSVGVLGSLEFEGTINSFTLQSVLMDRGKGPIVQLPDGSVVSLLRSMPVAYHLENRRFVRYLREKAVSEGVGRLDRLVESVHLTEDRDGVASLKTREGDSLAFDLYVDCTGFSSLLLERAMGVPFTSWESSLPTDRALVFDLPLEGAPTVPEPFTSAITMDHGWAWKIPVEELNHMGYVYSSAFSDEEQAREEVLETFPDAKPSRVVRFRSGRHEKAWVGNVVAIGNSYAFVEPLQSTGVAMILAAIHGLIRAFPESKHPSVSRRLLNEDLARRWDGLRWFLAVHFRFNRQRDTAFWRAARHDVDISGIEAVVSAFQERAPLMAYNDTVRSMLRSNLPYLFYGLAGLDTMLLGMGVSCSLLETTEPRSKWDERRQVAAYVAEHALFQRDALQAVRTNPSLLREQVDDPASWVRALPAFPMTDRGVGS